MLYFVWIFFFFWGNKGSIFSDLSLGYPLPGMSTTAMSNLRPIQKHFSELEIQSTTFSNNVFITVGKIKWVKTTKAQDNWIKGLIIFADEEWTSASRTSPRRIWFLNAVRSFPRKSPFSSHFFSPWNISNIPISSVYSLTGIGNIVSTPVGLTGRHDQFAGNNPYCGKSKSWISCLRCKSWGCRSP